jgi:hypothetical protein
MSLTQTEYEQIVEKHTTYNSVNPVPPKREIYYVFEGINDEKSETFAICHPELMAECPYKIIWRLSSTPENLLWEGRAEEALSQVEFHLENAKSHKKMAKLNGDWFSGPQWGDFDEQDLQHYIKLHAGIRGGKRMDWKGVAEELRDRVI